MANQFSGVNAEIWWKVEPTTNGVMAVDSVGTPLSTTLTAAANPGDNTITVAGITNAAVGDIIRVGTEENSEIVKIHDSTAPSGNTITLDDNTTINFRHESGEAVLEVDPTQDWFRGGNITNFVPNSDRPLDESQAPSPGVRGISNLRLGSYTFGADITIELDVETTPLWIYYGFANDYATTGTTTAGASTTTDAIATAGDAIVSVATEVGFAVGEYAQLGTGNDAEVIKIGAVSAGQLDLDPAAHPNGLRKTHAASTACDEVIAPFTHVVNTGAEQPVGLTLMLRLTEGAQESIALMYGNVFNTVSPTISGDTTISTMTVNTVAKRMQVLSENIFGTPTTVAHKPYAQYEALLSIDGVEQTDNRVTSLTMTRENNVGTGRPIGTALPGSIRPGQGRTTGTFDYEYETQDLTARTQQGTDTRITIDWTYILDANHSLQFDFPKTKLGGNAHPAFDSLDPITDSKSFSAIVDPAQTPDTDFKMTATTNNPTIEYLVETA